MFTHRITLRLSGEARVNIFKYLLKLKKSEPVNSEVPIWRRGITGDVAEMDNFYLSAVLPRLSALLVFATAALTISYYLPLLAWTVLLLLLTCRILIPCSSLRKGKKHELLRSGYLKHCRKMLRNISTA